MDACKFYRLSTVMSDYSTAMESLAYENATPLDVAPPPLRGNVWLLGLKYSLPKETAELSRDVRSRLWFTYRKNFKAISGTNITCDSGWGCTLRCGQMVMGNTLLHKHLGRDWRRPAQPREMENATYMRILKMFLDRKDSEYSLHMIAHQGADFGRPIGQWFGPNNVAQALKKLSTHESWTQLAVHVALDMVVVVEDMKELCREPHRKPHRRVRVELAEWERQRSQTAPESSLDAALLQQAALGGLNESRELGGSSADLERLRKRDIARKMAARVDAIHAQGGAVGREGGGERGAAVGKGEERGSQQGSHSNGREQKRRVKLKLPRLTSSQKKREMLQSADFARVAHTDYLEDDPSSSSSDNDDGFVNEEGGEGAGFRSLLLFIPLRLGQEKFNMEYKEALKACLTLPQSAGIIGGKPRHALYFIGYHGDSMLYLDPHTTQQAVSYSDTNGTVPDQSYHCSQPDRMNISDLDPSVALAFFCRDEADIDDVCHRLRENVLSKMQYMFELTDKRPVYWAPAERNSVMSIHEPFFLVNKAPPSPKYTCEEDSDGFEVIDYA